MEALPYSAHTLWFRVSIPAGEMVRRSQGPPWGAGRGSELLTSVHPFSAPHSQLFPSAVFPYDASTNREPRGEPPVGGAHRAQATPTPRFRRRWHSALLRGTEGRCVCPMDASSGMVSPMALKFAQGAGETLLFRARLDQSLSGGSGIFAFLGAIRSLRRRGFEKETLVRRRWTKKEGGGGGCELALEKKTLRYGVCADRLRRGKRLGAPPPIPPSLLSPLGLTLASRHIEPTRFRRRVHLVVDHHGSAGGGLDDGGPTSPFLIGGVPSSPSPDDKGRSAGVGGASGGVGPLLPTAQPAGFPMLGGKQPGGFPLSLLYGQPSSYLLVGSAPFMPLPPQGDLSRGLLFPPLHAGFDPLAKERMASCLDLAARSYAHQQAAQQRPGAKGSPHDMRSTLLGGPTLPFPSLHDRWRSPHMGSHDLLSSAGDTASPPSPFGQDRSSGSPPKGLDLKRPDHLTGPLGSPKWTLGQATSCPVCGITLAQAQMADHFQLEMDKLADFYSSRVFLCSQTYLKVRGNRHQRLNALCGRRRRSELPLDLQSADSGSPPGTPRTRGPPPPLKVELSDAAYESAERCRSGSPGGKDPQSPSGTRDRTGSAGFTDASAADSRGAGDQSSTTGGRDGSPSSSGAGAGVGSSSETPGTEDGQAADER
ncbi:hypothetical protein HPB48_022443 [Haemaphysalis longicornis]|uniref:Uncharacterized protein n=1 Tax=Haemaphysalis longicornis TaxID=44386 RepID=A0A9J6FXB5_HAELO|nr:hypothetical protein HPB48_022443 [Haemaphysalis longicornis]